MTRTGKKYISRLMISHSDLDGHGALILGQMLGKMKPHLSYTRQISVNYGFEEEEELWKEILTYDIVHITDISVPEDKHRELLENCKEVVLFDHHDSSKELEKFENTFHDTERCGTKIYFEEYFCKNIQRVPSIFYDFVNLVNVYDTWQEEDEFWEEACNMNRVLMGLIDWNNPDGFASASSFYAKYQVKLSRLSEWKWLEGEKAIIKRALDRESKMYSQAIDNLSIRKDYKGDIFGVANIGSKISLVCARILKEIPELRYIIIVNSFNPEEGRMSIRSRDPDFDCTKVFPFEGHTAAAGGALTVHETTLIRDDESLCFIRREDIKDEEIVEKEPFMNCIIEE